MIGDTYVSSLDSGTYSKKMFLTLGKITKFHTHSLSPSKVISENVEGGNLPPRPKILISGQGFESGFED